MPVTDARNGNSYVWISSGVTSCVSCCLSPSELIGTFRERINNLEDIIRPMNAEVIIGGDFNARAMEWRMQWTDSRGASLVEMAARLNLTIMNTGMTATFRKAGTRAPSSI